MTSTKNRAQVRAARERQARTGEPYTLAKRNARINTTLTHGADSVFWHGVLAKVNSYHDDIRLVLGSGMKVPAARLPLPLTVNASDRGADLGGAMITKVWTQPSPYNELGQYLMARGTAWGRLGQVLREGGSPQVNVVLDSEDEQKGRKRVYETWRLVGGAVVTPGEGWAYFSSARIWYDPMPQLQVPRAVPVADQWPVRLPHVPEPALGERLEDWIERAGADLRERRRAVMMEFLGLEPGNAPVARIKELAAGISDHTSALFTAATGFDGGRLAAMVAESEAYRDRQRAKSGNKAVAQARRDLVTLFGEAMERSCPPGGRGYGGSLSLRFPELPKETIAELRAALRKAGKSLGWKTHTGGYTISPTTFVYATDEREPPAAAARAVAKAKNAMVHEVMEQVHNPDSKPKRPTEQEVKANAAFSRRLDQLLALICGSGS